MSHFNTLAEPVRNLAGGRGYRMAPKFELASLLLTSFGDDKYYQKAADYFARLETLIKACGPEFSARAIVYARNEFGMRTVSHYAASIMARYIHGESGRKFYNAVVRRPDDITEIIACHLSRGQKLTAPMKKGFADALGRFDAYQLAKYRGEGRKVKLVDAVNLCHPKPTDKSREGIAALIGGTLASEQTWEAKLSAAGKDLEKKKAAWRELLQSHRLGYFALLRNMRNILLLGDDALTDMACDALVDEKAIKKSLVFPFRFITAFENIANESARVKTAIARAAELSLSNIPVFKGKTLVALDVSGSMIGNNVSGTAAMFAAALAKTNEADVITFANNAEYRYINPGDSLMTITKSIRCCGGGTCFNAVFDVAKKHYDRIILLSDMQAWEAKTWSGENASPSAAYNRYKRMYSPGCKMYSIDLAGYGTLQVPEKDTYCLAGFSEKLFDVMGLLESDANALVSVIDEYNV